MKSIPVVTDLCSPVTDVAVRRRRVPMRRRYSSLLHNDPAAERSQPMAGHAKDALEMNA
jgi:hypothetical protein